jgi:uncharacterized protein (TIGR04255 family)
VAPAAFEPVHDAHAIEQVTFSLQFTRHLDDAAITRLQAECAARLGTDLPGKHEIRSIGVSVGPQGLVPIAGAASAPDGFLRMRVSPTGAVEKELRVERGGTSFRTTTYTRWAAVWADARRCFEVVMGSLPADVGLVAHSLQYVDRFDWSGTPSECRAAELIAPGSEFVAPYVFRSEDLWHSHFGAFMRLDEFTKRLLLVNLDALDEASQDGISRRSVRITTGVTDLLSQPGYRERVVPAGEVIRYLDERQDGAHTVLKNVIGDILNDGMRRKIGIE